MKSHPVPSDIYAICFVIAFRETLNSVKSKFPFFHFEPLFLLPGSVPRLYWLFYSSRFFDCENYFISQKYVLNPFWVICANPWIRSQFARWLGSWPGGTIYCDAISAAHQIVRRNECNAMSAVQQIVQCDNTRGFCILRDSTVFEVNCTNPQESAWNGVCGAICAVQQMVRCGKKPLQIGENAKMSQFLKVALTQIFSVQILQFSKNF